MEVLKNMEISDADGYGKKDVLTFGSFSNGTNGYYGQLRIRNWNGSAMFLEKSDEWREAAGVNPGAAEYLKVADGY